MLGHLLTEQRNPASAGIDTLSTEEMLRVINAEDRMVADAVAAAIPQIGRAVEVVVTAFERGGRLFYIGAGTSGRLGVLDASECPPTYNVPPDLVQGIIAGGEAALTRSVEAVEDDPAAGAHDLKQRNFGDRDVAVGIAASGRTPYVLGAVRAARELGATTIGISCTPASELSANVDLAIEALTGPEIVTGSTRMKAGTATKLILNMLTTGTMIRMGYVYGNLMINVQPRNQKLVDRSRRIIVEAADVSYERAAELFDASGQALKTAIVMGRLGVNKETAEARLASSRGRVSDALKT
jgi:N-acetylmuramic acid 6-phosphate etherase